jgi:hypothetical protein
VHLGGVHCTPYRLCLWGGIVGQFLVYIRKVCSILQPRYRRMLYFLRCRRTLPSDGSQPMLWKQLSESMRPAEYIFSSLCAGSSRDGCGAGVPNTNKMRLYVNTQQVHETTVVRPLRPNMGNGGALGDLSKLQSGDAACRVEPDSC